MRTEYQELPLSKMILNAIKYETYLLIYKSGFPKCDRDDIIQELTLAAVLAIPKHDPSRSSLDSFLRRVVRHHACNLRRQRMGNNHAPGRIDGSLNENVFDEEDQCLVEYGQTIGREDAAPGLAALQMDTAAVLAKLPPSLRSFCEALKHKPVSRVAAEFGISIRSAFNKIKQLRKIFTDAGLTPANCDDSTRAERLWQ